MKIKKMTAISGLLLLYGSIGFYLVKVKNIEIHTEVEIHLGDQIYNEGIMEKRTVRE